MGMWRIRAARWARAVIAGAVLVLAAGGAAGWAAASAAAGSAPDDSPWPARVVYVTDGDSLWVRPAAGGRRVKLRLEGIDAPEICQAAGRQAREALQQLVLNQAVTVQVRAHDRWGRGIARVRRASDGADVADQLAAAGWAWSDDWGWRAGPYAAQAEQARRERRGLFAQAGAQRPRDFRKAHGPCSVPGRQADATPGRIGVVLRGA